MKCNNDDLLNFYYGFDQVHSFLYQYYLCVFLFINSLVSMVWNEYPLSGYFAWYIYQQSQKLTLNSIDPLLFSQKSHSNRKCISSFLKIQWYTPTVLNYVNNTHCTQLKFKIKVRNVLDIIQYLAGCCSATGVCGSMWSVLNVAVCFWFKYCSV